MKLRKPRDMCILAGRVTKYHSYNPHEGVYRINYDCGEIILLETKKEREKHREIYVRKISAAS